MRQRLSKKFENAEHRANIANINMNIERMKLLHPRYSAGEVSDGFHTFNELYDHRALLFAALVNSTLNSVAWKSRQHADPAYPMYEGMFIVGIDTPIGQATYHYDIDPYWDMFHCKELERAPKYDGHSPADAVERIFQMASGELGPQVDAQ